MAREELLTWPVVGAYLRATRQLIASDHAAIPARRLVRNAASAVAGDECIAVFPQGSVLGASRFAPGATGRGPRSEASVVGIAPREAATLGVGVDHGVPGLIPVGARMTGLRVTAADVTAGRAQADVEAAATFLACVSLRGRDGFWEVLTWFRACEELLDDLHARIVPPRPPAPL